MVEPPEVNDFVELTFENDPDGLSPICGRVVEVTVDPDRYATDLMVVVTDPERDREVVYAEGSTPDEEFNNVTLRKGTAEIGSDASLRVLD